MAKILIPIAVIAACLGILSTSNYFLDEEPIRQVGLLEGRTRSQHEAFAKNIMISTQGDHTTKAGIEISKAGGNIYDVAAAVSFMISVERPQSTGIGGGGFLIHLQKGGEPEAIDFREMAPLRSHKNMYLDGKGNVDRRRSIDGPLAIGVPGLVAGVLEMHEKYGKLKRSEVLAPAIKLAREGFKVYPELAKAVEHRKEVLKKYAGSRDLFFHSDTGTPIQVGDIFVQEDLADVLEEISDKGKDGFYKGWVAKKIVSEMRRQKGLIKQKDLDTYEVKWREPVKGSYRGHEIISMPPPSSGGAHIIQLLNMLEQDNLAELGVQKAESVHLLASALHLVYIDRARYLGDADFVKVPMAEITSRSYAKKLRAMIKPNQALHLKPDDLKNHITPYEESTETTHFSIMDNEGNVVVSTQTINGYLGSGLVVPGTGIVMNNEMDDFAAKKNASNLFGAIGGENNLVKAKKRPLSSMSPTIVLKNGEPIFAVGARGGTRIITCVIQTLLNYFDFKLPLYESVTATRIHHQWLPDKLTVRNPGFSKREIEKLQTWGHTIDRNENTGCYVQVVAKEEKGLHGVSDPRGIGMAIGH